MPQRHLPAPVANSVFRHVRTRRPKTNGKAERFMRMITRTFRLSSVENLPLPIASPKNVTERFGGWKNRRHPVAIEDLKGAGLKSWFIACNSQSSLFLSIASRNNWRTGRPAWMSRIL